VQFGGHAARQPGGVAAHDPSVAGAALGAGQGDVGAGQRDPAGFVLDAEAVAAGVDGFDQGGADPGEGVEYQVPGRV
jgi:hypothetical protein